MKASLPGWRTKVLTSHYILRCYGHRAASAGLKVSTSSTFTKLLREIANFFQRFGAVGGAASVLFCTDRLTRIELGRQKSVENVLHVYREEFVAIKQSVIPECISKEGYAVDFQTEQRSFDKSRCEAEMSNFLNVPLLIVAAPQWRFGDWIVRKFMTRGQCVC